MKEWRSEHCSGCKEEKEKNGRKWKSVKVVGKEVKVKVKEEKEEEKVGGGGEKRRRKEKRKLVKEQKKK